jgi:hypothetical protein
MPFETYGHKSKAGHTNISAYKRSQVHYINYSWALYLPVLNKTHYFENQIGLRHPVNRANLILTLQYFEYLKRSEL